MRCPSCTVVPGVPGEQVRRALTAGRGRGSPCRLRRCRCPPSGAVLREATRLWESTYHRVWRKARQAALTAEEYASPLARRPYDLRHAAVLTWLNAGVPATQVAEWAGQSVAVMLQIYAKCLSGQEERARKPIEARLRDA